MKKFGTITVVGLGVVGGALAKLLSARGYRVCGVDCDGASVTAAARGGAIAAGAATPEAFFPESELVVLALYPDALAAYLERYGALLPAGAIVMDVAGLKSAVTARVEAALPAGVRAVFCHPMAGREKRGFAFADERVFAGANFLITPTPSTDERDVARVRALAEEAGFGRVSVLTPEAHDRIIAYTSQLPHALAVSLVSCGCGEEVRPFIGDSYRDLTRIADINEDLWSQLFLGNRDNLLQAIGAFEERLDAIKDALERKDAAALKEIFIRAAADRRTRVGEKN